MGLPGMLLNDPTRIWKVLNVIPQARIQILTLRAVLPDILNVPLYSTIFLQCFVKDHNSNISHVSTCVHNSVYLITFSAPGITKTLNGLKNISAIDLYNVLSKFLKDTSAITSPLLAKVFPQSISTLHVPKDWRFGKAVAVFKKLVMQDSLNFHTIYLTSTPCKPLEHTAHSNISSFVE